MEEPATPNVNSTENIAIEQWIESAAPVTIYLKNGIGLKGKILAHNDKMILLSNGTLTNNVQKQGISTISPAKEKKIREK